MGRKSKADSDYSDVSEVLDDAVSEVKQLEVKEISEVHSSPKLRKAKMVAKSVYADHNKFSKFKK